MRRAPKDLELAVERHAGEMRADHGDGDVVRRRQHCRRRERRLRLAGGAERQPGVGMEHAAERGERGVLAGLCKERNAERRAVGVHRRRHCQRAEIEQVDEVGVGAEPAVEPDRIGVHLLDGVDGRHRRQHQRVDRQKRVVAHAAQLLELIECGKGVDRARMRAGENDLPRHRMHGLGDDAMSLRAVM